VVVLKGDTSAGVNRHLYHELTNPRHLESRQRVARGPISRTRVQAASLVLWEAAELHFGRRGSRLTWGFTGPPTRNRFIQQAPDVERPVKCPQIEWQGIRF
jgi:hypothetical protein